MFLLAVPVLIGCGAPLPEVTLPTTRVIGHRGAPGHLPDHTLAGYRLAVEMGADVIEPDLVSTRDGVLIARHENDLTHTTDIATHYPDRSATKTIDGETITGWFSEDFDWAELSVVRAVQPYATRPHDHDGRHAIPRFEEILALREELSGGRIIGVEPEIKHPSYFRSIGLPLEERVVDELRAHHLSTPSSPVWLQSFEPSSLDRVGQALPIHRVLLFGDPDATPPDGGPPYGELLADLPALRARVEGIGVHTSHIWTPTGPNDLVERAHAANLEVHVYTFRMEPDRLGHAAEGDPRRELRRFYDLGVDAVFADYPDVAVAVRGEQR
jgi:glycerophosphoryl diester phosphodiesterase